MRFLYTSAITLLFVLTADSSQALIRIEANGSGDYPTIQAALNVAPDGEVVELGNGVYMGSGNRNLEFYTDITIRSIGGYEQCVLDLQGSAASPARGFALNEEADGTVSGLTLRNGYHTIGGAVQTGYGNLQFTDCLFQDNHATDQGGAWHGADGGLVTFRGCVFSGNTAGNEGGALYGTESAQVTLENCTLVRNGAVQGGGLYLTAYAEAAITNTIIAFSLSGGAIVRYYDGGMTTSCLTRFANRGDAVNDADPLLVDPMATPFPDVGLTLTSPCRAGASACGETIGAGVESSQSRPKYGLAADGSGLYSSISDAAAVVPVGATIVLEDGAYTGSENTHFQLWGKSLISRSNDPIACRIDLTGQASTGAISLFGYGPNGVLVRGIGVCGANLDGSDLLFAVSSISTTLENCVFEDNFIRGAGNDLLQGYGHANLEIVDCLFQNNTVLDGHLIAIEGEADETAAMQRCELRNNNVAEAIVSLDGLGTTLSDIVATENTARSVVSGQGGELFLSGMLANNQVDDLDLVQCLGGDLTLNDCEILDNVSSSHTVYVEDGTVGISDCLWQSNESTQPGGGLALTDSPGYVTRCRFDSNTTTGHYGGGLYFNSYGAVSYFEGSLSVSNCEFLFNSSAYWGGGLVVHIPTALINGSPPTDRYQNLDLYLTECTFHGNARTIRFEPGAQIELRTYSSGVHQAIGTIAAELNTCLVTGGEDLESIMVTGDNTTAEIHCSNFFGNDDGDWEGDFLQNALAEPDNLNVDPLYCDAAAGDLSLYDTSPCLAENALCNLQIGANGQGCSVASSVDDLIAAPRTGLTGNYPNPFNPRTTVCFELAEPGPVTVQVYDLTGRRVRTLLHGDVREAGPSEVVWNGRDDRNGQVSAGIYQVQMVSGAQASSRKVMMIK